MSRFSKKLQDLEGRGRLRALSLPHGIDLTSNDYLGMRAHPALRRCAVEALEVGIDLGAGGSRLLRGHSEYHEALEDYAAGYFGFDKALYFSTGFQANLAIFQALVSRHDAVVFDALVHASSREGIANSSARAVKFRHNDLDDLGAKLQNEKSKRRADGMIWVVVESLYSMDGDFAPAQEIQALCQEYGAYLIVDEAHATGIYESVRGENIVALHTCGKAVGVAGGLVCAPAEIVDVMINAARGFIYSTAPPPLQALLCQKSLEILASADGDARRARLQNILHNVSSLREVEALCGGSVSGGEMSQIVPIMIGDDREAVRVAAQLQREGFDVRAIRPPTVPEGSARLRVSLNCDLTEEILRDFKDCLGEILEGKLAA